MDVATISTILGVSHKAVDLLNKGIDLASRYNTARHKIFSEYIEPSFLQLQPLIEAYIVNISQLRQGVSSAHTMEDLKQALDLFKIGRISVVLNRERVFGSLVASIASFAKELEGNELRKREAASLLEFLQLLTNFFRDSSSIEDHDFPALKNIPEREATSRRVGTMAAGVIRLGDGLLDEHAGFDARKTSLSKSCDIALRLLESRISDLNRSFTALKLECLG